MKYTSLSLSPTYSRECNSFADVCKVLVPFHHLGLVGGKV